MMYRAMLLLLMAALVVGAGLWHGILSDRWGQSDELTEAVRRLENLKANIGEWDSTALELDPRQLREAEILGYVSRRYVNRISGEQVGMLLIYGRLQPVSVHNPEICFQGAGYVMDKRRLQSIRGALPGQIPEFWSARFTKDPAPEPLHILWAWSHDGHWLAPEHPRWHFYRAKALYKLYLIRQGKALDATPIDSTLLAFVRALLPELQQALFPSFGAR